MTMLLLARSVTTPRIRMGGLVASSATWSDRTSAIGCTSAAVPVPLAAAGDELRPHHAPAQARMTAPSLRNVLESLVPIMNSLLSRSPDRSLFLHGGCRRRRRLSGPSTRGHGFLTCGIRAEETDKLKTCRHGWQRISCRTLVAASPFHVHPPPCHEDGRWVHARYRPSHVGNAGLTGCVSRLGVLGVRVLRT